MLTADKLLNYLQNIFIVSWHWPRWANSLRLISVAIGADMKHSSRIDQCENTGIESNGLNALDWRTLVPRSNFEIVFLQGDQVQLCFWREKKLAFKHQTHLDAPRRPHRHAQTSVVNKRWQPTPKNAEETSRDSYQLFFCIPFREKFKEAVVHDHPVFEFTGRGVDLLFPLEQSSNFQQNYHRLQMF